jgi:hypothetical protein
MQDVRAVYTRALVQDWSHALHSHTMAMATQGCYSAMVRPARFLPPSTVIRGLQFLELDYEIYPNHYFVTWQAKNKGGYGGYLARETKRVRKIKGISKEGISKEEAALSVFAQRAIADAKFFAPLWYKSLNVDLLELEIDTEAAVQRLKTEGFEVVRVLPDPGLKPGSRAKIEIRGWTDNINLEDINPSEFLLDFQGTFVKDVQ